MTRNISDKYCIFRRLTFNVSISKTCENRFCYWFVVEKQITIFSEYLYKNILFYTEFLTC